MSTTLNITRQQPHTDHLHPRIPEDNEDMRPRPPGGAAVDPLHAVDLPLHPGTHVDRVGPVTDRLRLRRPHLVEDPLPPRARASRVAVDVAVGHTREATAARVLVDAADLIDLHGRCRGASSDTQGRICAIAAINWAAPDTATYLAARGRLLAHLVPMWDHRRTLTVQTWNDSTADDAVVVAAMREAAAHG